MLTRDKAKRAPSTEEILELSAWDILAGTRREDETETETPSNVRRNVFDSIVREAETDAGSANSSSMGSAAKPEPSVEETLTSVQQILSTDRPDDAETETATSHETADLSVSPLPDKRVGDGNGDARATVETGRQGDSDKVAQMLAGFGVRDGFDPRVVEGIAADLLRPMVHQWLGHSLPSVIESLVRAEIEQLGSQIKR